MAPSQSIKKELVISFFQAILAFTLIPGIAFIFTYYVTHNYRLRGSDAAQFYAVYPLAYWLLIGGAILFIFIIALGAIAFINRKAQYISFVTGWRLLVLACAVELIVQGIIAIWLSYWLSAVFFKVYVLKLILVVILFVGAGVLTALFTMFKRLQHTNTIEGELLARMDAPALWERVDRIAKKLGTQPPDQIIAGIDTNFFVTESPITLNDQKLKGRTLFISIPLLQQLSTDEADSVLAHELCHLRGGDTANSAALYPKLLQCNNYISAMYENPMTRVVYYPLNLYRLIFELALQRESRRREFMADKAAASVVSPQGIAQSLIKIEAYAAYRAQTEGLLFEQNQRHDENIGIAQRIAQGLPTYVFSERFLQDMKHANIPHPFDSHPLLAERMQNVNHVITPENFAHIITQTPVSTWVDLIPTAKQIENNLWSKYEKLFSQDHEQSLAYRYVPENEQQEQIVLKYFPPLQFGLKGGQNVQVTYQGIIAPGGHLFKWDDIKKSIYNDGFSADSLVLTLNEKKMLGNKKQTIKLAGIKPQRQNFKNAIGQYWHRHSVMVALQEQLKNQASTTADPTGL